MNTKKYPTQKPQIIREIAALESFARKGKLIDHPFVRNCLYRLSIAWDIRLAAVLKSYLVTNFDGSALFDNVFAAPSLGDLNGELFLGDVIGNDGLMFQYDVDKIPMHILATGTSGSGKTNFAKVLIEQAIDAGISSIKISDPKAEYEDIARKHPDFFLLRWDDLQFNPLLPPPNVPEREWDQTVIGHMAQCFNFWEGAQSLFLKLISKQRQKGKCPTFVDLLAAVNNYKHKFYYKDLVTMSTVASRLELLIHACGDVVSANTDMLPYLNTKNYILQTAGLMSEMESWMLEFLLIWEFYYRLFNNSDHELTLRIYDECQHRLFNSEKERNVKKIGSSMISMLVDEARSLNIGIVALSQEPSVLIKGILNNSRLKLAFHLGSGTEIKIMASAMGLDSEQEKALHHLDIGEAIIRMAGGFTEAFPAQIRLFQNGLAEDTAFKKRQQQMKRELYSASGVESVSQTGRSSYTGGDDLFEEIYDEF
ncbi:ATP-binding protein [bacterium]|nr:ATP-binding protein [bacterium]